MASRRTIVPNTAPADDGSAPPTYNLEDFPLEAFENPIVDTFKQTGDMAMLRDAIFNDWTWTVYRLRSPEEMREAGTRTPRVFVTKTVGPFDVVALQRDCGGGVYEIRGSYNGHFYIRHIEEIDGPRRVFAPMSVPTRPFLDSNRPTDSAPTMSPHADAATAEVMRRLDATDRMLERIADKLAAAPPAAAPAGIGIADVLALADRLNDRREQLPTPTGETMKELVGLIRMGMDLKADVNGPPETSMVERVLDRALPSLERIAVGLFTARGGAVRGRPGAPAGSPGHTPGSNLPTPPPVVHRDPSGAAVLEPAPAPGASGDGAATEDPGAYRWRAAIEALAKAVQRGDEPAAFADTLELLLPDGDLDMLAGAPDAAVVAQLRGAAGGAFPVLETPEAERFIAAVLTELRDVEPEAIPGV